VGPNSTVVVSGGCELVVTATGSVSIGQNSTITVSFHSFTITTLLPSSRLNSVSCSVMVAVTPITVIQGVALSLTAGGDMHITGTLSTSGQGTLDGPGAPSEANMGNGGTYGGSGGILDCHDDYYTAPAQVWTSSYLLHLLVVL
jgi:hypothetical protein